MKKILIKDYPSILESRLHPEMERTFDSTAADVIVNPEDEDYINKHIIINLPVKIDLDKISTKNSVFSRFPITDSIPVEPYPYIYARESIKIEDYSCLILNRSMLEDIELRSQIANKNFLVGIGTVIDGHPTAVGYELCKTRFEDLIREDDPFHPF